MREMPEGANLLQTARDTFEAELLPLLTGKQRHAARMIMRAMDIAGRELQVRAASDEPSRAEIAGLRVLLGDTAKALPASAANASLAQEIRAGLHDPGTPQHAAVLRHLREVAKARLAESNPRVLGKQASR